MTTERAPTILRGIGRWDLAALMVNITIGAGILGLPAKLFDLTHGYSVLALVLCAVLIGFIQICFAEVGSRFVDSGGPYLIARTALGPSVGFVVGWLYWIVRVLTFATISNLLVAYVARFVPGAAAGAWRATTITLIVGGITLLHLFGIRHATIVSNALTILKIGFLAVFGVLGTLSATGSLPERGAPPPIGALGNAILLGTFAFAGFEASMVAAGETRDPRRNTPFAIATSLLTALVLYLGVQVVCMMSVPALATSAAPVADAAVVMWGPFGEQLVAGSAIVMMLGTLNGGFLATSRLPFAFAEQGDLPAVLTRVHARFRTPHVAILGSAAIVLVATLASSFLSAIKLAASTRILAYIAGCVALIVLRRRADVPPAAFVAPYGRAFAVIAIALSVALLSSASGRELIQLGLAASSGIVVYALFGSAAMRARRREALKLSPDDRD
jgi:basic amino acid/polyamine antiporter, APA family